MWKDGIWEKGGATITGRWMYQWSGDYFTVTLDKKCRITGRTITVDRIYGESPDFNGWKLVRKVAAAKCV